MRAFLSLRTQFENLGDELINSLLVLELTARMPVEALSSNVPDWYLERISDRCAGQKFSLTLHESAPSFAKAIGLNALLGRQSLLFTSAGDVSSSAPSNQRRIVSYALKLPGTRLAQVGASFSRLAPDHAELLRRHAGPATSVRDTRSQKLALEHGARVQLVPDLAFLRDVSPPDNGKRALLSLRHTGQSAAETAQLVRPQVEMLRNEGLAPVISWQVEFDRGYCLEIADLLDIEVFDFGVGRPTIEAAAEFYKSCAIVTSNRLHVLLLAASAGCAIVPLIAPSETKIRGVLEDSGLIDLACGPEELLDRSRRALEDHENPARLARAFAQNRSALTTYFDGLLSE